MRITAKTLRSMKAQSARFAGLVLYDACFARLAHQASIEVVVVGDLVGMIGQGNDTTVPTTMDEMVYHTKATARGHGDGLLFADLPKRNCWFWNASLKAWPQNWWLAFVRRHRKLSTWRHKFELNTFDG